MNDADRTTLISNTNAVFGNDWFENQGQVKAKLDIATHITKNINNTPRQAEINTLIQNPDAKSSLDNYFTYAKAETSYKIRTPD
jgi:hypothetical protein